VFGLKTQTWLGNGRYVPKAAVYMQYDLAQDIDYEKDAVSQQEIYVQDVHALCNNCIQSALYIVP
jgi:hypothetical protein